MKLTWQKKSEKWTQLALDATTRIGGGDCPCLILLGELLGIVKEYILCFVSLNHLIELYVSESQKQIKVQNTATSSDNCYSLVETRHRNIFKTVETIQWDCCAVGSIQTLLATTVYAGGISPNQRKQLQSYQIC
jgi:predicted ATP-dependent serine protease